MVPGSTAPTPAVAVRHPPKRPKRQNTGFQAVLFFTPNALKGILGLSGCRFLLVNRPSFDYLLKVF
jgi:hypothetical protein